MSRKTSRNLSGDTSRDTSASRSTNWLVPATLLAGLLLLTGAVTARNGTLMVVSVIVTAATLASATRYGDDQQRERERDRRR